MYIQTLGLSNFRNYENLQIDFSKDTNILYGDNAQGKTNILEALYMAATTKSHRGVRDRDLIRFGQTEAHIRTVVIKNGVDYRIDMHLRAGRAKGIAINGQRIKRASDLIGLLHIVFFSPEDLGIVRNGPSERRNFLNAELCQLDGTYMQDLSRYNRALEQRNKLLRDAVDYPQLLNTLDVWDQQLITYGTRIIERRTEFISDLNEIIDGIHRKISGGRETLQIAYEPSCGTDEFEKKLGDARTRDSHMRSTSVGPHRDDFSFIGNDDMDLRRFGSQGQQRTCALSLKLSEIELVTERIGDRPVLMLDDVLSELDSRRQNDLLNTIGGIQTFITCTGLDEFVKNRFHIDRLYHIENGAVVQISE